MAVIENDEETICRTRQDEIIVVNNEDGEILGVY